MQPPENFRSLASILCAEATHSGLDDAQLAQPEDEIVAHHTLSNELEREELELLRDVRLFHARIIEAVEEAVETLVTDIAADVLGRELQLQPVDIETIVDRVLQRFAMEQPVHVRVHSAEAAQLKCTLPVVADDTLRRGDAVLELRNGAVDASLGVRLASVITGACS